MLMEIPSIPVSPMSGLTVSVAASIDNLGVQGTLIPNDVVNIYNSIERKINTIPAGALSQSAGIVQI